MDGALDIAIVKHIRTGTKKLALEIEQTMESVFAGIEKESPTLKMHWMK